MKLRSLIVLLALWAGLTGCALATSPEVHSLGLIVRAANFPSSLTVGTAYPVRVTTYLGSQALKKPYSINIYRTAWSAEGVLLKQDVLVGSQKVWPHIPNTYRTVDVIINLPVLRTGHRGLQEAFARRNVFTVKAEGADNQLTREVPVTH